MNAIEVVQRANKAYNAHDADALAVMYADGATYGNPRAGQGLTGKAITNYAKAVWSAYPDALVELITVGDTGGGLVAAQWVLRGTNTGTLPDGTSATGCTVTLPGATFTQVEGDKIRLEEIYFDRQNLLEQAGTGIEDLLFHRESKSKAVYSYPFPSAPSSPTRQ
jgi:steroid delta-isomerase-like uncharacterized protein